jgi:hypothetical protein
MAVNNKQPIRPSRGRLYIGVKVLKPRKRELIINPASIRNTNNPVTR